MQSAAKPVAVPAPTAYAVTKADGNSRVWERTVFEKSPSGQIVAKKRGYTELGTGLNYKDRSGQWVPSKEFIEILPNGTAQAIQGQHQAYFPGNIYKGVVEVVTPDGVHQKSRPMGLSYFDGTNSVLIAELKSSAGVVVGSNVVIFPDAFTDFKADIRYTYKRGSFEQDVVLLEQPPAPETFGLNPATARLEVLTEFFNTADPVRTAAKFDPRDRLQDDTLAFGKMQMMPGKAFVIGDAASTNSKPVKVSKSWQHLEGRTFLVEELPVRKLATELQKLPLPASAAPAVSPKKPGRKASTTRVLPPVLVAQADTDAVHLALNDMSYKSGVVLDYAEVGQSVSGYCFSGDTTYYISSEVDLYDTTTFQGGAVLKIKEYYGGFLNIYGPVNNANDPSHPVIITSSDDDTVGEVISGSSGYPNVSDSMLNAMNVFVDSIELDNFRFNYCSCAYANYNENSTSTFWNCEFNNCNQSGMIGVASGSVVLRNVLNSSVAFSNPDQWCAVDAQQITSVNQMFIWPSVSSVSMQNSIIIGDSGDWQANTSLDTVATSGVDFASDGINNYYLAADSSFRNVGTTGIDGTLLSELQGLTTYAPQDGSGLDNDQPDLGYHYVPPPPNPDSDGDGLPDWWEMNWFGNLNHVDTDLDASGHTLLYDFQNGISPWDSDSDGLQDWWEMMFYGNLGFDATTLDTAGNTLLDDYQNGIVPQNVIQFSITATNDYVNHTNVSVQLDITAGMPGDYAVLVNGSTTTNWLTFTTTNLAFNLGTTDGIYMVSIGLKGLPADAQQTWSDYGFTVDRVAPVLVITNPMLSSATGLVVKPYLQLQGFAREQLTSLSYDITNAMGKATNLDAFVTDQGFDTNLFDFTTNYFQAYDVPLTNGVNKLTLRVTDRAGNTTTTNFSVTLDYATATDPVVKLIWPTNNMAVSGTSITIRGTMSDETGTIVAQVVNGDGTTHLINGLVERNGMFWLEDVPLNGISQVSIQATDASGNHVTTTNFTVNPSAIQLKITSTPTGDDLYKATGTVSGTVSDASATVTVNGMSATVNPDVNTGGTYGWSADDVPIYGQGTATFNASAQPANVGAPANAMLPVEKGAYVAMVSYNSYETKKLTSTTTASYYKSRKSLAVNPVTGPDGQWQMDDQRTSNNYWYDDSEGVFYYHQNYQWSDYHPGPPTYHYDNSNGNTYDGLGNWPNDPERGIALSAIPHEDLYWGCAGCSGGYQWAWLNHYYAEGLHYHWDLPSNQTMDVTLGAVTEVKLFTGGKAGINRWNLFGIHASAYEYFRPPFDSGTEYPWSGTEGNTIDPTKLIVAGEQPGSDGYVWRVLRDNSVQDVTVRAPGYKHFSAESTAQKGQNVITVNGVALDPYRVAAGADFCVGQSLTFGVTGLPSPVYNLTAIWTLPGTFVNTNSDPNCDLFYEKNAAFLQPPQGTSATHCWYVLGGQAQTASVRVLFRCREDGRLFDETYTGKFNVHQPTTAKASPYKPDGTPRAQQLGNYLSLGDANRHEDMSFAHEIQTDNFCSGEAGYTQVITRSDIVAGAGSPDTFTGEALDGALNEFPEDRQYPVPANSHTLAQFYDAPHVGLRENLQLTTEDVSFSTYLMFRPNGSENNIWVPLRLITWELHDTASYNNGWSFETSTTAGGPTKITGDDLAIIFPHWTTTK